MSQHGDETIEQETQRVQLLREFVERWLSLVKRREVAFKHDALAQRERLAATANHGQLVSLHIDLGKNGRLEFQRRSYGIQTSYLHRDLRFDFGMRPGLDVRRQHLVQRRRIPKS